MAMTIELWEDNGPLIGSPLAPTLRQQVNNLGWRDSALDETYDWVDYPILRPPNEGSPGSYALSYTKYFYYKIYGTYDDARQFNVYFNNMPDTGDEATNLEVLFKLTNTYSDQVNTLMPGATVYNGHAWTPKLSTTDPRNATSTVTVLSPNTTYYSEYIVTQLRVYSDVWTNYGNINENFQLQASFKERKTGLPDYDSAQAHWSW